MDVSNLTTTGTLGVVLDPFIPRQVLHSHHSLSLIGWFRCDCLEGSTLGHTRMTNTFPQVSANQLEIGIFEISEQVNKLDVKICSLNDFTIETTASQSSLTSADLVNSLPAKSVLAGTKLVLFGRHLLKFYVGIVQ